MPVVAAPNDADNTVVLVLCPAATAVAGVTVQRGAVPNVKPKLIEQDDALVNVTLPE